MRMLLFALAEKLGIWDVDTLAEEMPGHLLMEWRGYREAKTAIEKEEMDRTRLKG